MRAFLHHNNNTHQVTTHKPQKQVESTLKLKNKYFYELPKVIYEGWWKWKWKGEEKDPLPLKPAHKQRIQQPLRTLEQGRTRSLALQMKVLLEEEEESKWECLEFNSDLQGLWGDYVTSLHTPYFTKLTHPFSMTQDLFTYVQTL